MNLLRYLVIILFCVSCITRKEKIESKPNILNTDSKIIKYNITELTELSELGIRNKVNSTNPIWDIRHYDVSMIDTSINTLLKNYISANSPSTDYNKFNSREMIRQYSGLNGNFGDSLILIRFYNYNKIYLRYGNHLQDTLEMNRGSYFHFFPDFYFIVFNLKTNAVVEMKW